MSDNQTSYDFLDKTGLERLVQKIKMDFGNTNYEVAEYDESVALYSHSVDEFVYFNGGLYKVTSAINVGDSIAVGVNITSDTGIEDDSIIFIKNIENSGNAYNAVFILKSGSLQEYGNTGGGVTVVSATLLSANWSGSSQTITVSGMTSNANGEVGLPSSATSAQRSAARDAQLAPTAQDTNLLTITADKTVPSIDIPIEVVIY